MVEITLTKLRCYTRVQDDLNGKRQAVHKIGAGHRHSLDLPCFFHKYRAHNKTAIIKKIIPIISRLDVAGCPTAEPGIIGTLGETSETCIEDRRNSLGGIGVCEKGENSKVCVSFTFLVGWSITSTTFETSFKLLSVIPY
jgi:hypothetical protein